jgi:ribosomal protein L3 glutamine methyltransferase
VTQELSSIKDFIRFATSRFNEATLCFGHGFDSALDEASYLVLHTLYLPHDMPPAYADAVLTLTEREQVLGLIRQRIEKRIPVAYLTGEAWFAGLSFKVTPHVLIPRSPIAELITQNFAPWIRQEPANILDLCTGSGCIAIACAVQFPDALVTATDVSHDALALATENATDHGVLDRLHILNSDLFDELRGQRFDLIVTNPPYVGHSEYAALPSEFGHEPKLGLVSGDDGMDIPLVILAQAPEYLTERGLLVLEVGASADTLSAMFGELPGTWLEFAHGGSGVLAIEAPALRAFLPQVERMIRSRREEAA